MHSLFESMRYDLRFALRGLARNPGFTLTAVLAAALGIGASTAVFSAVDRILFRALPYRQEARLVSVGIMAPLDRNEFLFAQGYFDLRHNLGPFDAVTSFQAGSIPCDLTEHNPIRLDCLRLEANFLDTFGMAPVVGRAFTREEDRPNGPRVAMISYALWRGRFGSDPAVAGRTLTLDGAPVTITGVLPKDFLMPTLTTADILLPLALNEATERSGRALRAFGRLKAGVPVASARAMLQPYFARVLESVPPQFRKEVSLRIRGVRDRQVGEARLAALTLLGAVLSVLLIACANIANLLLARAAGREREMAVRRALGASRGRLARQVLTESLLLGGTGGVAGCGLAWVLLHVFQRIAPGGLPRLEEAGVDVRVLLFAIAASMGAGLLFGMAPALRREGAASFGGGLGGGRATSRTRGWMRGGLVTAQIAISVILVTGAGLLLRSLWNLERVPLGIERDHVMTAKFVIARQRYAGSAQQLAFFDELERRLRALPGVSAAAISDSLPPAGGTRGRPFSTIEVEGRARRPEGTGGMVAWRYITPDYFRALGIAIRRGRAFGEEDRHAGVESAVISETLARMMFGGQDPIGKHILRGQKGEWFTVIGVAADARNLGLDKNGWPEYYLVRKAIPDATWANQEPPIGWREASIVVSTPLDPRLTASSIRALFSSLDPTLPVQLETMHQRLDGITARPRFQATLLGVFAATGLLLAAIGLFGVMSFLVAQRRREIGLRMALGATPRDILRLTLAFAARWTGAGMAAGALGAIAVMRWLRTLLFGVEAVDIGTLSVALGVLAAVGLLAAAVPARRAARLDPMTTLRED